MYKYTSGLHRFGSSRPPPGNAAQAAEKRRPTSDFFHNHYSMQFASRCLCQKAMKFRPILCTCNGPTLRPAPPGRQAGPSAPARRPRQPARPVGFSKKHPAGNKSSVYFVLCAHCSTFRNLLYWIQICGCSAVVCCKANGKLRRGEGVSAALQHSVQ